VVPDVVGRTEPNAIAAIIAVDNLTIGSITYDFNDTIAAGLVISQNPIGGTTVSVGSFVDLVVSLGEAITVPNVVDQNETDANSAITAAGLIVGTVTYEYSDIVPADIVISQNPLDGTIVPVGSAVDLVVSLGQPVVPDVVGMTEPNATADITAVDNLTVDTVTYEYSATVAAGHVISQDPAGGTTVPIGSSVDLVVAAALVPDIVGMTKFDANSAIAALGFITGTVTYKDSDTVAAGLVISQNPVGGTALPVGSSVDFAVSLGQPVAAMGIGGSRLVELQNNDGGWDRGWPPDDGDPNSGSDPETFASVAMGLAQAYRQTGEPNMLAALQKAKTYLLSKTDNFAITDGALAVELDSILGDTACVDYVSTNFYDKLEAGTYYDVVSGAIHDTNSYIQSLRDLDEDIANLAAWDLGLGLYSAYMIGANTTEWIAGVKTEIDELDGGHGFDVLGLAGAVFGLAAVGEDYDPQAGQHEAASSLGDLAAILASYQIDTGGFTWHWLYREEGLDEIVQETVYGLMALNEFDRDGYLTKLWDAGNYLQSIQLVTGGWENYPGYGEKNEITGESLRGIDAAIGQFVVVPDVVGMTEPTANSSISAAGLTVGTVTYDFNDTVAKDIVISQNPVGETTVPAGLSVDLVVSLGEPIDVPNVVDQNETDANSAITTAGLIVGTVTYEYSDMVPAGVVISQNPVGGTPAPIGSPVDLVVSLGLSVSVPDVADQNETDANSAITAAGLTVGIVTYGYSDTVAEGLVISQNPIGGTTVPAGSSVDLVVSLGQPEVPNVVGMTEPNATAEITAVDNLTVGIVTYEYNDTVAINIVISQNPIGGTTVSVGSSVDLAVSLGEAITVPNVVDQNETDANSDITAAGLIVGTVTYEYSDIVPAGIVISQNPLDGTIVPVGSAVDIVVSLGQPVVPNVVGMTEPNATVAITAVDNLEVGIVTYQHSDTITAGYVISQNPTGSTQVPIGSSVDLIVSLGPPAVVPDVVGRTEPNATADITAVGLVVGTVTYEYSDTVAIGLVISQNPVGGTTVSVGSSVDFAVSLGPPVPAMGLGGSRLVELQNNDGGWDQGWPPDDGDPNSGSDPETFASVAMGLAQAYRQTGDPNMLAALQKAKTFLLSKTDNFVATDGGIGVELDSILSGAACVDHVITNFYDKLEAGTYYDARSGIIDCNTAEYIQAQRNRRTGTYVNLAAWDLGLGLYSAYIIGANTTEWITGVKAEIDELDGNYSYDVLGLAGAVFGLAGAGEDYDPQAGQHEAASSLGDLAAILASYQLGTGGFTWYSMYMNEGEESIQETVYGLMALNEFDRAGYLLEIRDASVYLQSVQLVTGGWENYPGYDERNEITGEALRGIAVAAAQPVVVPDVVGMTEPDANSAIAAISLVVGAVTYEYSDTVTEGFVINQNPVGETAAPVGSSVDLIVSLGQPEVPDVVGMTEADATAAIIAVDNLTTGTVTYDYNDTVTAGLVISQNPVAETTVPIGSFVNFVVSLGQPVVPDVVGMTEPNATADITAIDNLTVGIVTYEYNDTVATDIVMSQNPAAYTVVPIGSSVDFVVSLGQPEVPNVVGMSEANATTAIEAVDNLVAAPTYRYDNNVPFGDVISQDPLGGTVVNVNTTVNIVVSLGQPLVPGVVGESEAEAIAIIEAIDELMVGTITYEYSGTVPVGFVISQDPAGGTAVPIGSSVDLVVSLGQSSVVPYVVGITKADANSAINAVSLVVGNVTYEYSKSVAAGPIISQSPVGGTVLLIGSSVDFVVSIGEPAAAMGLGGNRLVEVQNNDGGWDRDWPPDDGDPNSGSDPETFASVAMGLVQAYRQTGEPNMLAALQKAKTYLLSKTDNFAATDGALAVELDSILGDTACVDYVSTNFYDKLEAGTYYDVVSDAIHDTNSYIQTLRDLDEEIANLAAWDLGLGLYSAYMIGANTTEWIAGVKAEIDELDGGHGYDVLGLAGAVFGLTVVGEDYDPQAGQHEAASSLGDLVAILAGYQLDTGGFTWYWMYREEGLDEMVQETVYGLMALNEFDRDGYLTKIWDAGNYLQSIQLATGGWENYPGYDENNEITGEVLSAIAMVAPPVGDFDRDGDVDVKDFAIFALAWLTEDGDTEWNPDFDISYPNDDIIDEPDLAVFVDNWLVGVK
jgi:beta-lactam-binding protein with PASTA domain